MSDEFLYQPREPPRPEFAEALKTRIFQELCRSPTVRKVWRGLVVLLVALVIAACAAPQTRTPILKATETVIGRAGRWLPDSSSMHQRRFVLQIQAQVRIKS